MKPKTGVGHYIESLFAELQQAPGSTRIAFYPHGYTHTLLRGSSRLLLAGKGPVTSGNARVSVRQRLKRLLVPSQRFLRGVAQVTFRKDFQAYCARQKFDLYHEPNFLPWPVDLPTIVTIHDLSVLLYPQWHPTDRVHAHEQRIFTATKTCRHFITDSEYTRQEVIRHLGLAASRVTAIHLGIRPQFRPLPQEEIRVALQQLELPQDYLLCVGTIEPRKNILTVLKAYVDLPSGLRAKHPLVLAGGWGWKGKETQQFYEVHGRAAGVLHCGYVPEASLPALYNGARALLYPSHYEGFGLPPIEMLACGGSVLASTAGAVAEVLHGHATPLIDPADVEGWRDAIYRIVQDDDWHRHLRRESVAFAQRYTWAKCAAETLAVYRNSCPT